MEIMDCDNFVLYQNIQLIKNVDHAMLKILVDAMRLTNERNNLVRTVDLWLLNSENGNPNQRLFDFLFSCVLSNFGVGVENENATHDMVEFRQIVFRQKEDNLFIKVRIFLSLMSSFIHKETFKLGIRNTIARYDFSWNGDKTVFTIRPLADTSLQWTEDELEGFNLFLPIFMRTILS